MVESQTKFALVAGGALAGASLVYALWRRGRRDGEAGEAPAGLAPKSTFRHFPVRPAVLGRSYSLAATSMGEDRTVRVVCYGDSNTWGFDSFSEVPESDAGGLCRFGDETRWPRVAAAALGPRYAVVEEGLNGRTTVHPDPLMTDYDANGRATMPAILHSHKPVDLVVIMLGTNDLKTHLGLNAAQIAKGASTLVGDVFKMGISRTADRPRVLLIAPPAVWDKADWAFGGARAKSMACAALYKAEAEAHGCDFLDANDVFKIPDPKKHGGDGIHLSPANSAAMAAAVAAKIRAICEP